MTYVFLVQNKTYIKESSKQLGFNFEKKMFSSELLKIFK